MLWLKAFHIIFVVTWFAGLFYLPRLFVYHAETEHSAVRERLKVMQRRLLMMTHIGGVLTVSFGLALLGWWQRHDPGYLAHNHWLQLKLLLVAALIAYHLMLVRLKNQFARHDIRRTSAWPRAFPALPTLLLIAIVLLVVLKPF